MSDQRGHDDRTQPAAPGVDHSFLWRHGFVDKEDAILGDDPMTMVRPMNDATLLEQARPAAADPRAATAALDRGGLTIPGTDAGLHVVSRVNVHKLALS